MTLKKQTIWLLTMLSLIIVLSVYYVQAPNLKPNEEFAAMGDERDDKNKDEQFMIEFEQEFNKAVQQSLEDRKQKEEDPKEGDDENKENHLTTSDTFAALRLQIQNARDQLAEEYTQIVASTEASATMKSEAHDRNLQLINLAQNEATLETLIKAKGYENALVMVDEENVHVIVQADELSRTEANSLLQMAYDRFGTDLNVAVSYEQNK